MRKVIGRSRQTAKGNIYLRLGRHELFNSMGTIVDADHLAKLALDACGGSFLSNLANSRYVWRL
jgi:hypothetical protein